MIFNSKLRAKATKPAAAGMLAALLAFAGISPALAQRTVRISTTSNGTQSNGASYRPSFSANGRYVAFFSNATNLVSNDSNGNADVFVKDTQTGATTLASSDSSGVQANSGSSSASISSDGRYVAFYSSATNLTVNGTSGNGSIFVKDMQTGAVTLASSDSSGVQANDYSNNPSISSDGRYVAFYSSATNLTVNGTNGYGAVYVKDTQTGATTLTSSDSSGVQANSGSSSASISSDGRYVAFYSSATNLTVNGTSGNGSIFVKDMQTGAVTLASSDSSGVQANDYSNNPSISSDGRYVAFYSSATNLTVNGTNGYGAVYVKDTQTGATTLTSSDSSGVQANDYSDNPSISSDGRYVAFLSYGYNLTVSGTNGYGAVFVKDTQTGAVTLASSDSSGVQGNGYSEYPSISSDGRQVAFNSYAFNLVSGDTNGVSDIFVRNTAPLVDFLFQNSSTSAVAHWATNGFSFLQSDLLWRGTNEGWLLKGYADFDGDGAKDAFFVRSTGQPYLWKLNASSAAISSYGQLTDSLSTPIATLGTYSVALIADFNHDGKADLLLQDYATGAVKIWCMDGFTVLSEVVLTNPGDMTSDWHCVAAPDIDGDGTPDIVLQSVTSGKVFQWTMNAAGTAIAVYGNVRSHPLADWTIVGGDNFTNGGPATLIFLNSTSRSVYQWTLATDGTIASHSPIYSGMSLGWTFKGIADMNNDGMKDLLWQRYTGEVAVWSMNTDMTLNGFRSLAATGSSAWGLLKK